MNVRLASPDELEAILDFGARFIPDHYDPTIWKLYVDPSRRGDRIGPRMIAAISDHLPKGTERSRAETFAVNRRARAFYEREGFREFRTVEHPDPAMGIVWFERSLD